MEPINDASSNVGEQVSGTGVHHEDMLALGPAASNQLTTLDDCREHLGAYLKWISAFSFLGITPERRLGLLSAIADSRRVAWADISCGHPDLLLLGMGGDVD